MPEEGVPQEGLWRALADPTRRRILDLLQERPRITREVASEFAVSRIAVMRHLDVLAEAGLVTSRKRGRERWHYVNVPPLIGLLDRWIEPTAAGWSRTLLQLRERVEAEPVNLDVDLAFDVPIAGEPHAVFAALTEEPGAWWGHPYLRAETTELAIDARVGGHFVERWPGGEALIATVTAIAPDRQLQLTGAFHLGVALGVAEYELRPTEVGTAVGFAFRAVGAIDAELAEQFGGGWRDLVAERLKAYVETGRRLGLP